jgi:hypothetical protein
MKKYIIPVLLASYPLVSFAALGGIKGYITDIGRIVEALTVVAAGAALLVFFWGLVKFITKAGDEGAVEEGRRLMLWGIVALFVMVSVWGLVQFLNTELGIGTGNAPAIPTFPRTP